MELSRSSISTYSYEEKSMEDLIERMKTEEQRMEQELESMEHGEDRMKYKISLMKHYENRMEHEIELMKRREKPIDEVFLVRTPIYDDQKYMKDKIEQMKKHERHMNYEIERMEHYERRLFYEIRSIKNEIRNLQYLSSPEYHDAFCQGENETNKYTEKFEELRNELVKHEAKLAEHLNEIKKRKTKLEEHCDKRSECENNLTIIRNKIAQEEKERIQQEKQFRNDAIKRRENSKKLLVECRAQRSRCEIELLERSVKHMRDQLQLMEGDEKRKEYLIRYHKLNEELSIKWQQFYTFHQTEQIQYEFSNKLVDRSVREISQHIVTHEIRYERPQVDLRSHIFPVTANFEISAINQQPKYDIFISSTYQNDLTNGRIKKALPQWFSTHVKGNFSSPDIKICLDNTSTAVIAIIDKVYELSAICQADMIHIFKRQFPLVLVISEDNFKPSTSWLNLVWRAPITQKVILDFPDFEENLRRALTDAQWNLSPNLNISKLTQSTTDNRSNRFLGDHNEWTIAYSNPARVSQNYRQFITDPLRIDTEKKLQNIYYNYIRMYFENSDAMNLFEKDANENDVRKFIRAYTQSGPFSATLNCDLATNVLYYFEPTLYETVNYQLVNCLIDFVAVCIYRQELQPYLFSGTVYRGVVMSEEDLFKYVVGSRIMNTSFLSTSKDNAVAEAFSGKGQHKFAVVCTYGIRNRSNRRTALDISSISCFPHEREVLILPFSAFCVKSVTRSLDNSKPIEMTLVEDDTDISEDIYMMTLTNY